MPPYQLASTANQSLAEGEVGEGTESIVYPGIRQCFAIAGWTQNKIIGTHVSPGFTADDMATAFDLLQGLGGSNVMYWYILGPFVDHFAVGKAQWRCVKDIKKTFKAHFKNDAATHLVLDASTERHTKRRYDGIDIPMEFSAIDIMATVKGITTAFAYRERKRDVIAWTPFDLLKFQRI